MPLKKKGVAPGEAALSRENGLENQMHQVDMLVNNTRLLLCEKDIREMEDIRASLEALEHWMTCYRSGLAAANRITTRGSDILQNIKDRLESKDSSSHEQAEMLNQALRRLETLMFPVGQMCCVQPLRIYE